MAMVGIKLAGDDGYIADDKNLCSNREESQVSEIQVHCRSEERSARMISCNHNVLSK